MTGMFLKSLAAALCAMVLALICRQIFKTDLFLTDVGGISIFASIFGTLYGIMTAFIVFEVWNQYNRLDALVSQEGQGLERLYRLTLYFRDDKLTNRMKEGIEKYIEVIIKDRFKSLGEGNRDVYAGKVFREIFPIIRDIKFDDDHDAVVFDHLMDHFGDLSQTRTDRIAQSITRLPRVLKMFLYMTSAIALTVFVFMPFANPYYAYALIALLTLILSMTIQLIEDLDNPFVGDWNLTIEPFERALKHIEENY